MAVGAAAALAVLAAWVWILSKTLAAQELAYKHPKTEERVRVERVEGPVRTRTVIVEVNGRKETVIEELRGPIIETRDALRISEPVFAPAAKAPRWIIGAGLDPFSYADFRRWEVLGGYSFLNRLDLVAGVTGRGQARLQVQLRFR